MSILQSILFGLVVLITHFLEGITGFGCTVLALPFGISLAGVKIAVPVLVVIAWVLALYIVIIDFKKIVWKEYFKIVAFVILGLPIGMWLFSSMPDAILKKLLGSFMIMIALRGLAVAFKTRTAVSYSAAVTDNFPGETKKISRPKYWLNLLLFLGGIVHGAFGSGGPLVVIYAAGALPAKSNFRATLCALWFTLNSIIIIRYISQSVLTVPVIKLILWALPFLVIGMILGNIAHDRIKENAFIKLVYAVLLVSGFFMFI